MPARITKREAKAILNSIYALEEIAEIFDETGHDYNTPEAKRIVRLHTNSYWSGIHKMQAL